MDRHHCRYCNKEVCSACSEATIKKQRACRECFKAAETRAITVKQVHQVIHQAVGPYALQQWDEKADRSNSIVIEYLWKNMEISRGGNLASVAFMQWVNATSDFNLVSVDKKPETFALGTAADLKNYERVLHSAGPNLTEALAVSLYDEHVYNARKAAFDSEATAVGFYKKVFSTAKIPAFSSTTTENKNDPVEETSCAGSSCCGGAPETPVETPVADAKGTVADAKETPVADPAEETSGAGSSCGPVADAKGEEKEEETETTAEQDAQEVIDTVLLLAENKAGITAEELFRRLDKNNDGKLSKAEWDAGVQSPELHNFFAQFFGAVKKKGWQKKLKKLYSAIDTNKDNVLTMEELVTFIRLKHEEHSAKNN
jgi:hypothetical protein